MTYDQYNAFCGSLPATSYVCQWGGSHVWKVGGKVFAIGGWDEERPAKRAIGSGGPNRATNARSASEGQGVHPGITFKVSEMGWEVLRDAPGCRPAPYLASRGMKWIQSFDKPGLSDKELKAYLKQSHALVAAGLPKKVRKELGLDA